MSVQKPYVPIQDVDSILPILGKISLFGGFTEEQLYFLFSQLEIASFRPGERVFHQGDQPTHIYIIKSGQIKIVIESPNGPLEICDFGVGDCFGETSLIGIQPHTANAIALEPTELMVLSRKSLLAIANADKDLFGILILNIAREACRRLHHTDEILLHYVCQHRNEMP